MKQLKRSISLVLALVMVLSLMYFGPVAAADAATASDYISESYASDLSVRTTRAVSLKEVPASSAAIKYTLPTDTMLTVRALHKSTDGTYWYEVVYYDMTLYVDAAATTMVDHLTGDVTTADLMTPAALGYKSGFPLGGTISSSYNELGVVTAAVHYSSNITAAPAIISTDTINGKSYTIDGSTLDSDLIFSDLAAGSYTFLLSVEAISYYIDDSGALATHTQTVVLDNKPLVVTNASSANTVIAKGIDVSYYQGTINWATVATQVDFAILRLGYATTLDSQFKNNAAGCNANGVPFGVYIYSYAESEAEAIEEAEFVISVLKDYDVDLPVFFDIEDECQSALGSSAIQNIVKAFCETIKDAGYEPGLYTFLSWFNSYFSGTYYNTLPKWVAQISVSSCSYAKGLTMWQYSWTGSFSGISGDVDCNYYYGEFPGKNTDTSYLASCTYYPSNLDVTVSSAVNMRQYPSTDYSILEELAAGTQLHVTGVYKNTYGNYWYQVDRGGVTGYIDASYADVLELRYDDLAVLDPTMEDLALNSGYYLKGKLMSKYNNLTTVSAKVYSGEDTLATPVLTSSDGPNAKEYTLNYSTVCDNLIFSDLETGYYTYEISADVQNYYVSGDTLTSQTENVVLWTKPFTVGDATIEPPADVTCDHDIVTDSGYAATCTATGLTDGSHCTKCGLVMTPQTVIAATGHQYVSTQIPANCIDYEKVGYTCSNCGDSYNVYVTDPEELWTETKPENADESLLETKIQYRYSDFETVTTQDGVPDGYTLISQEWIRSGTGTVQYVSDWPAGFDTSHSLYSQYNNTPFTATETASEKIETGETTLIGYVYYHWCRGSYTAGPINRTTSTTQDSTHTAFHAYFLDAASLDPTTLTPASDGSITNAYASGCTDSWWWYYIPVYAQDHTTYQAAYTCEGWSAWSDWSENVVTASDTRKVESRTLYRDNGALLGDHSFVDGVCEFCGESEVCRHSAHDTNGICTNCGETVDHSYASRVCTVCGRELPVPTITPNYPTVSFEGQIQMNIYYTISDNSEVTLEDMGLITWSSPHSEGTIDNAESVISGATFDGSKYMVHTNGIPAKKLGDLVYFKIYAKLEDGTYVYSSMFSTSPKSYALSIAKNTSASTEIRALCVAMLNYGAAAQTYFSYKPYDLMNSGLTDEQRALVDAYDASMVASLISVDSVKGYNFQKTGGFDAFYPTVSFEGAFAINFYLDPTYEMDGDLTLYCWSLDRFNNVSQLSKTNVSKSVVMEDNGAGGYTTEISGIAAKQIDQQLFIAGVYQSDGVTYCTGVIPYSLGQYCKQTAAKDSSDVQSLAASTAVYGYYAKAYFASLEA